MSKLCLVILAASKIKPDFETVFNTVPAMLPFNGRPLIYQVIMNFVRDNHGPVVVALPAGEEHIEKFLRVVLGDRVDVYVKYFNQARPYCQMQTLSGCMKLMDEKGLSDMPLLVANGDIYFEIATPQRQSEAVIWVDGPSSGGNYSKFIADSDAYRYVGVGDRLPPVEQEKSYTDCGVYSFSSWRRLLTLSKCSEVECTVGNFISRNFSKSQIDLEYIKYWDDLGNLDSATKIGTKILGAREFNNISVNELRGTIRKSSSKNNEKILQEINYYLHLPKSLSIYFPRLCDFSIGKKSWYEVEFYPYKTLSEIFVMHELSEQYWEKVFSKIFEIKSQFESVEQEKPTFEQYYDIYIGKLRRRMETLKTQDSIYQLTQLPKIGVNGRELKGWRYYIPFIEKVVKTQYSKVKSCAIHGDMCFSNILYEPKTNLVKFIDPRGEFFGEGIYGDPMYDLAKLMHSVHGGYDFILHQMYVLKPFNERSFSFRLIQSSAAREVKDILLSRLSHRYSSSEIRTILVFEGLLFLTMLPLHSDDLSRQMAFYITALQIFDQADNYY